MLDLWIVKAYKDGLLLTGDTICQEWQQFADMCGIPQHEHLTLSKGWLSRCKNRTGLKGVQHHGEAASCYALTGHSSLLEVSWSGIGSGFSALATCDTDMW